MADAKLKAAICLSSALLALSLQPERVLAQSSAGLNPNTALSATNPLMVLFNTGQSAFNAGNYKQAIESYKSLIQQAGQDPGLESVYYSLGAAYFNTQDYNAAADTFAQLLKLYPSTSRAMDATFAMAQAYMMGGKQEQATAIFRQLENVPQFKQQIPLLLANAYKDGGKIDDAISTLEKLIAGGIQSTTAAKGAIMLAELYKDKDEVDKAARVLVALNNRVSFVENVAALNSLAVAIGDKCLALKKTEAALGCYRIARNKEQVKEIQKDRIAAMERDLGSLNNMLRENAKDQSAFLRIQGMIATRKKDIDDSKKLLEEIEKLPSIIPPLYLRIASAFYDNGQRWAALVVYSDLMRRFPDAPETESAMYASIVSFADINQPQLALELADQYLKKFPNGKEVATVVYLQGNISLKTEEFDKAESYFGTLLKDHADSPLAEQVRFLLGNSKFQQGKFKEAAEQYANYLRQFPKGLGAEEAQYREAISILFEASDSSVEKALPKISQYLADHPQGDYAGDAKYRLMVCLFANKEYDKVIESAVSWENQYGQDAQQLGEVLALKADAYAAYTKENKTEEAIQTYIRSYKVATTDEVINYSLFEASKLLQKRGDWDKVSAMFEEFVRNKPENPMVTTALFWIGKAKAKLGQTDEAKQFLAETAKKFIDDPKREAVEQIITQLAMLCTRKRPAQPVASGTNAATSGTNATPTPTPTPTPEPTASPADPGAELEALLSGGTTATARARVLYAKAELSRMRKQPDKEGYFLTEIAEVAKPEDLSPLLLGVVGERLATKGQMDKAEPLFNYLLAEYPKSDLVDFGYAGLGNIAYEKQDYEKAKTYFEDGIRASTAEVRMRELTLGQAKTLLALKQYEPAKKIFKDISSRKEWKGEPTAAAFFYLGEIEKEGGHFNEAIVNYQHVFVAYQKFLPWVAKSYIQSAICFEKLGKTQEAMNTYQELLRNEKLKDFPEAATARKAVQAAGGQL
jgi:TolA-binding protein